MDPNADISEATGVFGERFVKQGYGAAWSVRAADLDGNGTNELIYGGKGVVAIGEDNQPLWTFELPAVEGKKTPGKSVDGRSDEAKVDDRDEGKSYGDSSEKGDSYEEGDKAKQAAEKLRFMGEHVRDVRAVEGTLLVLDSENRVHRLDAATGELVYTVELEGDGNACDFALIDADGDNVPDFFPSGGTAAYSGETGKKLWDADIDFTPTIVKSGNLDTKRGKELLLIGNADAEGAKEDYGICPSEKNAFMAMHEGLKEEGGDQADRNQADRDQPPAQGNEGGMGRDEGAQSGIVAVDAKGKTLFTGNVPQGEIYTASIYDLDGDRRSEVIVGLRDVMLTLDSQGQVVQEYPVVGEVEDILAEDLDGDDRDELIVHAYDQNGSTVHAFGLDGMELWNAPLGARAYTVQFIDLDGDGADELVTGLGYAIGQQGMGQMATPASTVAWTLDANGPRELWRAETALPARALVAIEAPEGQMGGTELVIASGDAQLYKVSADTGETIDTWSAGSMNHAMGTGDLDGDGIAEVLTGDVFGNISAIGHDGEVRFEGKLEGEGPAIITGIEVAPNEAGNPGMFVVSGFSWRGEDAGVLQAFDDQGNTLFSINTPNGLAEAKFADLDGDGRNEIVVPYFGFRIGEETRQDTPQTPEGRQGQQGRQDAADQGERGYEEPMGDKSCGVMAYDLEGNLLWARDVADCAIAQIAVGDSDGDGIDEVAYGDLGQDAPYHMALLDGDGTVRWDITSDMDDAVWIEIIDEGVAFGGRSEQEDGHVTVLNAQDGEQRWRLDLGSEPNPDIPVMEGSAFGAFAGSLFGQKIDDLNGDRIGDLAFTTVEGDVRVVDGASGALLWDGSMRDSAYEPRDMGDGREDTKPSGAVNFVGGPLTYLPGEEGAPGLLVVTGYDFANLGSEAFAFDVDTGEVLGTLPLDELVVGVAPASWGRGENGVSITTTYNTYGLDIDQSQGGERQRPARDQGQDLDDLSLD